MRGYDSPEKPLSLNRGHSAHAHFFFFEIIDLYKEFRHFAGIWRHRRAIVIAEVALGRSNASRSEQAKTMNEKIARTKPIDRKAQKFARTKPK
ncbi:MAG: hypothetical protein ACRD7E_02615 [Bryobacteraceae bacterium]